MDGGGYAVLVRVFIGGGAAEGFADPAPDHGLILIGGQARATQMVGVDVGDATIRFNLGDQFGESLRGKRSTKSTPFPFLLCFSPFAALAGWLPCGHR